MENNYLKAPQTWSPKQIECLTKVTHENKNDLLKTGRVVYIIEKFGSNYLYKGFFDIRAGILKGKSMMSNHPHIKELVFYSDEDEDLQEYRDSMVKYVNMFINENKLYINKNDKIVNYESKSR